VTDWPSPVNLGKVLVSWLPDRLRLSPKNYGVDLGATICHNRSPDSRAFFLREALE